VLVHCGHGAKEAEAVAEEIRKAGGRPNVSASPNLTLCCYKSGADEAHYCNVGRLKPLTNMAISVGEAEKTDRPSRDFPMRSLIRSLWQSPLPVSRAHHGCLGFPVHRLFRSRTHLLERERELDL
jgi:hypothetical protein